MKDSPRGTGCSAARSSLLMTFTLFPFYWAIVASLTPDAALFRDPSLWPHAHHPRSLSRAVRRARLHHADPQLARSSPARRRLLPDRRNARRLRPGAARVQGARRAIMAFILAVTMFPQISIVSPLYLLLRSLHLIDTYPGLIMPYMTFAMPLTVWVLTGIDQADTEGSGGSRARRRRERGGRASRRSCCRWRCRAWRRPGFLHSSTAGTSSCSRSRSRWARSGRRFRWRSRFSADSTRCRGERFSRLRIVATAAGSASQWLLRRSRRRIVQQGLYRRGRCKGLISKEMHS